MINIKKVRLIKKKEIQGRNKKSKKQLVINL